MTDDELSLQYHSLRLYDGEVSYRDIPYRIGNNTVMVHDEVEHYYDTWIDFRLIPADRPVIALPKAKTKLVSIPGKSMPIDLTTYLTGHTTFENRSGQLSFFADNDFVEDFVYNQNRGFDAFDKYLRSILHGRVMKFVLRDDPSYFYVGTITLKPLASGNDRPTVSFSYNAYPYKKTISSSMELWKWDEFDFKDGIIMYMKDMIVEGSRIVNVYGARERISPHISGTSGLQIDKMENGSWRGYGFVPTEPLISSGSIIPEFIIDEGLNQIRLRGNGTVTIDYRRGLL